MALGDEEGLLRLCARYEFMTYSHFATDPTSTDSSKTVSVMSNVLTAYLPCEILHVRYGPVRCHEKNA